MTRLHIDKNASYIFQIQNSENWDLIEFLILDFEGHSMKKF